jgi:hypothetical protein
LFPSQDKKPNLQHDVVSLKVINTTEGCTLSGDNGIPIFTQIPRDVVLQCSGNKKKTELEALGHISRSAKQIIWGKDREGVTTTRDKSGYR